MKRTKTTFRIDDLPSLKRRLSNFLMDEKYVCLLDSCEIKAANNINQYELMAAFGEVSSLRLNDRNNAFEALYNYQKDIEDWVFGVLSYDLKNELHPQLVSKNSTSGTLPLMSFFQPQTIVLVKGLELEIQTFDQPEDIFSALMKCPTEIVKEDLQLGPIRQSVDKKDYIDSINRIKSEIRDGNVYEINYCVNYSVQTKLKVNALSLFQQLTDISPAPFAGAYRHDSIALIGSSPERYMQKSGSRIYCQPIKGTRSRGINKEDDLQLKIELQNSLKERAENVMIVDLVRNDLAHKCKPGSIRVSELFGIYSYEQVHQMISTIEGELSENTPWIEAIKNSFPMGSMTGAPKLAAMQLIDELENFQRGWYAGALGYVSPKGDFDFNVVIRSLLHNRQTQSIDFSVGGAITFDSTAEEEWAECQLKAKAIKKLLSLDLS
jgi:para-aminobenzoate synthetase component I